MFGFDLGISVSVSIQSSISKACKHSALVAAAELCHAIKDGRAAFWI